MCERQIPLSPHVRPEQYGATVAARIATGPCAARSQPLDRQKIPRRFPVCGAQTERDRQIQNNKQDILKESLTLSRIFDMAFQAHYVLIAKKTVSGMMLDLTV